MKIFNSVCIIISICLISACDFDKDVTTKEANQASSQLEQLLKAQPMPFFSWSLERYLAIELYKLRNKKITTHAVWRSDYGMIEGDCPSLGYGIPYDVQLTNPVKVTDEDKDGADHRALAVVEQPEPNGLYSSKNTNATWVMCIGDNGNIEPVYVESHVTVYPYDVKVDYDKNRVIRVGKTSATITIK